MKTKRIDWENYTFWRKKSRSQFQPSNLTQDLGHCFMATTDLWGLRVIAPCPRSSFLLFFCQGGSQTAILDQLPGVWSGSENGGNLYITYRVELWIYRPYCGSEIRRSPVDMVNIPIIHRVFCIPGGCWGFLPSRVWFWYVFSLLRLQDDPPKKLLASQDLFFLILFTLVILSTCCEQPKTHDVEHSPLTRFVRECKLNGFVDMKADSQITKIPDYYTPRRLTARTWSHDALEDDFPLPRVSSQVPCSSSWFLSIWGSHPSHPLVAGDVIYVPGGLHLSGGCKIPSLRCKQTMTWFLLTQICDYKVPSN